MRSFAITSLFLLGSFLIYAQAPFSISLEPLEISSVGEAQSFTVGRHEGKWLIIGGRMDGLHPRQPFAAFDIEGHNTQIVVIDPIAEQTWTADLSDLSADLQEQLSSTNMQFYQVEETLYILGGYGYSNQVDDHTTFPFLTAVNVPQVIDAVIGGATMTTFFRQIEDDQFAVTGGKLEKIGDTFFLVGGHNFEGRYNPMNMPTFTQEYTNAIRKFELIDDGSTLTVNHLEEHFDEAHLHRRDFNVLPQIMPDGSEGLTAFSGVFKPNANIPFLDCVNISSDDYQIQPDFSQYYNHYHCPSVPLYSQDQEEMHTLFFGGIAQYYEEDGELIMDDEVPFVKTIARVTRSQDGTMTEYKLPIEMPDYLGSGAEFIAHQDLTLYPNRVIDLDAMTADSTLIGYIYGGIESSMKNIFWINDGSQSIASSRIYEVYLHQGQTTAVHELNQQSHHHIRMQLYPNAYVGKLFVQLTMPRSAEVVIQVHDLNGRLISEEKFGQNVITQGENELVLDIETLALGQAYIVRAISIGDSITQKMIINE